MWFPANFQNSWMEEMVQVLSAKNLPQCAGFCSRAQLTCTVQPSVSVGLAQDSLPWDCACSAAFPLLCKLSSSEVFVFVLVSDELLTENPRIPLPKVLSFPSFCLQFARAECSDLSDVLHTSCTYLQLWIFRQCSGSSLACVWCLDLRWATLFIS